MNMNKIDINKQYRTRAGNKVLLFTDKCPGTSPIVGVWQARNDGEWVPESWTLDGYTERVSKALDLVEVDDED